MQIYEEPLVGIAAADDPLFTGEFKEPQVIGEHFRVPEAWVPGAASVVSLFLPFTEAVRASNRTRDDIPYDPTITNQRCSALWLHARIEGQKLVAMLCLHLCELLQEAGFRAPRIGVIPPRRFTRFVRWLSRGWSSAGGRSTPICSSSSLRESLQPRHFGMSADAIWNLRSSAKASARCSRRWLLHGWGKTVHPPLPNTCSPLSQQPTPTLWFQLRPDFHPRDVSCRHVSLVSSRYR